MRLIMKLKTPSNTQNNENLLLVYVHFKCDTPHCIIKKRATRTPSQVSKKCFWGNQLSLDIMKGIIIPILGYFIKHHVLIHFGLRYQKGIVHDQKDGIKLQNPSYNTLNLSSG
jgi:hypothetical protein